MINERTRTAILAVVTTVWVVNLFLPMAVDDYEPSEYINGIFMTIVGGALMIRPKSEDKKPDE